MDKDGADSFFRRKQCNGVRWPPPAIEGAGGGGEAPTPNTGRQNLPLVDKIYQWVLLDSVFSMVDYIYQWSFNHHEVTVKS